jgi:hypothetical protein
MASQWSEAVVSITAGDMPTVVWEDHREKCDYPVRIDLPDTLGGKTTIWFDDVATYRRWLVELSRDWYQRFGDATSELRPRQPEPELVDELHRPGRS